MSEESKKNNESSGSHKYLVRILLIVAIGIPVLLEFLTFFNLIKFRLWGEGTTAKEQARSTEQHIRRFSVGDTLFDESSVVIMLQDLRINVSPETWKLEMKLRVMKNSADFKFRLDSLRLENGVMVRVTEPSEKESEDESGYLEIEGEWTIPDREVPNELFMTILQKVSADSTAEIHKRIPITKPIVRYNNE